MLENKLKKAADKLVCKSQTDFVKDTQILDAMLIANESIDLIFVSLTSRRVCFFFFW